jgi:hypothetical protein
MITLNERNAFPEIIESILNLAKLEDLESIFSIKNHEGNLEIVFNDEPDSNFVNLITTIWFYFENNKNYSLKILKTYK